MSAFIFFSLEKEQCSYKVYLGNTLKTEKTITGKFRIISHQIDRLGIFQQRLDTIISEIANSLYKAAVVICNCLTDVQTNNYISHIMKVFVPLPADNNQESPCEVFENSIDLIFVVPYQINFLDLIQSISTFEYHLLFTADSFLALNTPPPEVLNW
ncbi:MAG: hypothetical protein SFW35_05795 [Chitinophagales bacterium]|nr:hypothetical protein [Chitinophagales bacterium]